jgi:hypothetical protein
VPTECTPDHLEKLLKGLCPNHAFPVKHLYKDCALMKWFLSGGSKKGEQKKKPNPEIDDAGERWRLFDDRWLPHDLRRTDGL